MKIDISALIFPGQGSQKIGMGKDLYDNYAVAKDIYTRVDDALGFKLSEVIFDIVLNADMRADYKYNEPSDLKEIKALRVAHEFEKSVPDEETLKKLVDAGTFGFNYFYYTPGDKANKRPFGG